MATLDPERAAFVGQGLETPANIIEELGLRLESTEPPGPIRMILTVDAASNVTLQADAAGLGKLVAFAARCSREYADRPDRGALSLTLSLDPSVEPTPNHTQN